MLDDLREGRDDECREESACAGCQEHKSEEDASDPFKCLCSRGFCHFLHFFAQFKVFGAVAFKTHWLSFHLTFLFGSTCCRSCYPQADVAKECDSQEQFDICKHSYEECDQECKSEDDLVDAEV